MKVRWALEVITVPKARVWFSGNQIAKAIMFHLIDEKWMEKPLPPSLIKWLTDQLPTKSRYSFKGEDWEEPKTGTHRMLWLMVTTKVDPFELCKWTRNPQEAAAMHRRFTNIVSSWYKKN